MRGKAALATLIGIGLILLLLLSVPPQHSLPRGKLAPNRSQQPKCPVLEGLACGASESRYLLTIHGN
jgi:hypothetical protein